MFASSSNLQVFVKSELILEDEAPGAAIKVEPFEAVYVDRIGQEEGQEDEEGGSCERDPFCAASVKDEGETIGGDKGGDHHYSEEEGEDGERKFPCAGCHMVYLKWMSYRNHISVCRERRKVFDHGNGDGGGGGGGGGGDNKEKARRSLKILELSCFSQHREFANAGETESGRKNDGGDGRDDDNGTGESDYHCLICDESFLSRKFFARHAYVHTFVRMEGTPEPRMCPDCGVEFDKKEEEEDPGGENEGKDKHCRGKKGSCSSAPKPVFVCAICDIVFTRKDNLRHHLKVHAGLVPPTNRSAAHSGSNVAIDSLMGGPGDGKATTHTYPCMFCQRVYGGATLLNWHLKTHVRDDGGGGRKSSRKRTEALSPSFLSGRIPLKTYARKRRIKQEVKEEVDAFSQH